MKLKTITALLLSTAVASSCSQQKPLEVDLAGEWSIKLDLQNVGIAEQWYTQKFNNSLELPGCLQAQGYGEKPSPSTVWWSEMDLSERHPSLAKYSQADDNFKIDQFLMPRNHYIGSAWYSREITIPQNFQNKRITLSLERCHWQSELWVDGEHFGMEESLATPHTYDLTQFAPGKHTITLRIDNSMIYNLGEMPHSVSDQTQGTWNGVVGEMKIVGDDNISISQTRLYPDIKNKEVRVVVELANPQKVKGDYTLTLDAKGYNSGNTDDPSAQHFSGELLGNTAEELVLTYAMGDGVELWDEFDPHL